MAKTATVLQLNPKARKSRVMEVKIGDAEIRMLKNLVEFEGLQEMSRVIGVSKLTLLRVCAGWFARCNAQTQQTIRAFFAEQPQ